MDNSRLVDEFAKKTLEYMYDYSISDADYFNAYDQLMNQWIAENKSYTADDVVKLKAEIAKRILKLDGERNLKILLEDDDDDEGEA